MRAYPTVEKILASNDLAPLQKKHLELGNQKLTYHVYLADGGRFPEPGASRGSIEIPMRKIIGVHVDELDPYLEALLKKEKIISSVARLTGGGDGDRDNLFLETQGVYDDNDFEVSGIFLILAEEDLPLVNEWEKIGYEIETGEKL
jgi:hypothetical protein